MAFEEKIAQLRRIAADIRASRDQRVLRVAFDLSALIKLRIQTKGESASGTKFAGYVPAYARERRAAGYQVGYVDFTRTGRLFASVAPRLLRSDADKTEVVIESREQRGQDILKGAERKRGNILLPSDREIAQKQIEYADGLARLINF